MKHKLGLAVMVLWGLALAGCAPVPLADVDHVQVMRYDDKALTMNDMEHVIRIAAYKEEWEAQTVSPGHIVATRHSSDWTISVDILYATSDFSVHYKDSKGLQYNPLSHHIARHGRGVVSDLVDRIKDTVQDVTPGS